MKIEKRTFIVSGGSSGLGLATVEHLLERGALVSILDRSPPPPELSPAGHVKFLQTDITSTDQIQNAVDATVAWTAKTGATLGGVINSAGIATAAKIIDAQGNPHPLDVWNRALSVNLTGSFDLTRLALQHLVEVTPEDTPDGERGVVIFVASAAAFEGQPGQTSYSASKGALCSMALPMARDLARHAVRVVTIAPGVFDSAMTKQFNTKTRRSLENEGIVYPKRFGQPQEFAKTVGWILDCPYVNGETVRLSGAGRLPGKL